MDMVMDLWVAELVLAAFAVAGYIISLKFVRLRCHA
jgi:hypothetical protein